MPIWRCAYLPENHHVRMTYDRGELEMMSPSKLHEQLSYLIGRLIDVWTEELGINIRGAAGTVTFQWADLQRSLEPDNCYYIAHKALVRDEEGTRPGRRSPARLGRQDVGGGEKGCGQSVVSERVKGSGR